VSVLHFFQLLLLAALWGSSFMFMRIAVPALGPGWMLEIRLISATLFIFLVTRWMHQPLRGRRYWKHYLILGLLNTAAPFFAFAWASQVLPASILAIINSTAPLWGLVVGFVWRGKAVSARALLGLLCGISGVAVIVGMSGVGLADGALMYVFIALSASVCYAIASSYAEFAESVPPFANAHGSLWAAVLLITPFMPLAPLPEAWPLAAVAATLTLGIVCSGVAYLLYYHLISTIGAPSAMTVGYLIPLWGVFWGWLFLDEAVGWHTLAGAALVLTGTALVTGLRVRSLMPSRAG
jgi:drug/metabolite transporter (DMT)-like permease